MFAARLDPDEDDAGFREAARRCLALGLSPKQVAFVGPDDPSLFDPLPDGEAATLRVPRAYGELLADAVCHSAPDRFDLLYDVLWRTAHGERELVFNAADRSVARLDDYAHAVRRDIHKMHAFLRFRPREVDEHTVFAAWFEPQHFILRRAVPFFVDRFAQMDWLIATPLGTAAWRDRELSFGPPAPKPAGFSDAVLDEFWLTYYRTTFNPARLRLKSMVNEMPRHYWPNLPEAAAIPAMVAEAGMRVARMQASEPDAPLRFAEVLANRSRPVPELAEMPLERLRTELAACQRCPLYRPATQAVPGEGPGDARIMLIGEQPGDQEDLAGRVFVGPAGQLLDQALEKVGLDRRTLYVTNVVKHFKYEPRGKIRLHKKPNSGEVAACRWWLDREIAALRPRLVVALGATAATALARRAVSVTHERGPAMFGAIQGYVTVHPSYLLRLPGDRRADEYAAFLGDLRRISEMGRMDEIETLGRRGG